MAKVVIVEFTKPYPPYRKGDIAGFDEKTAKLLTEGETRVEDGVKRKYGPWARVYKKTTTEEIAKGGKK